MARPKTKRKGILKRRKTHYKKGHVPFPKRHVDVDCVSCDDVAEAHHAPGKIYFF